MKVSINSITLEHLSTACRHAEELLAINVTENLAIRTLEHFVEVYSKLHMGASATPYHVKKIDLWSVKAIRLKNSLPDARPREYFRIEHGTPRRALARKVLGLYRKKKLSVRTMDNLVRRYYRVAAITLDEDKRLNKIARSTLFPRPEDRWKAAGIRFPKGSHASIKNRPEY